MRIAEQEKLITSLMTVDSKRRLGEILMRLANKLGKPTSNGIRIEHRITHEELSEMVGTTRPRITQFLQGFRKLGLVEISSGHFLIIKQDRLITAELDTLYLSWFGGEPLLARDIIKEISSYAVELAI